MKKYYHIPIVSIDPYKPVQISHLSKCRVTQINRTLKGIADNDIYFLGQCTYNNFFCLYNMHMHFVCAKCTENICVC